MRILVTLLVATAAAVALAAPGDVALAWEAEQFKETGALGRVILLRRPCFRSIAPLSRVLSACLQRPRMRAFAWGL